MNIIATKEEIASAQKAFERSVTSLPHERIDSTIGYQSGSFDATLLWVPSLGFWAHFGLPPSEKGPPNRYWNVFGLGRPKTMVSIVAEINFPLSGVNRRVSGALAHDSQGKTLLLHRGRLNVRGGITKKEFRAQYRGKWIEIASAAGQERFVYIATLDTFEFGQDLKAFFTEVDRIKDLFRAKSQGGHI